MICPNCGTPNAEGARFCNTCGTPLTVQDTGAPTIMGDQATGPPPGTPPGPATGEAGPPPATYVPTDPTMAAGYVQQPAPPPSIDQFATPALQQYEAPLPPKSKFRGGLGALIGVAVVLVLGIVVWVAVRPHPGPTVPVHHGPGPNPNPNPSPNPNPNPNPNPSPNPNPNPGTINIRVQACGDVSQAPDVCVDPGFNRSSQDTQFFVVVTVAPAHADRKVVISYLDADTGQQLVDPNEFTLKELATEYLEVRFTGPFPQVRMEIQVTYNGTLVKFDNPPIVTLT